MQPVSQTCLILRIIWDAYKTRGPHFTPGVLNQNQQGRNPCQASFRNAIK